MLTIGVDVGSTAVKAAALMPEGEIRAVVSVEYQSFSPRPGWIEQDPDELWQATCAAIAATVRQLGPDRGRIRAVALSVQRGTFVPVDHAGHAIYRAVSWQDLRPDNEWLGIGAHLREKFGEITGLYPAGYWTIGKLAWIARHEPELWRATDRFLFVHGYLSQRLGCDTAVEDPTNASFSGLLDLGTRAWCDHILDALGLRPERLGLLCEPGRLIGEVSRAASASTSLPAGTAIVCGAGDQQAVALGAGIVAEGTVAVNIGTAGLVLTCTPRRRPTRECVAQLAHIIPGLYQTEGMLGSAGSVLRWLASLTKSATGFRYGGSIDRGQYRQIDAEAASVSPGSDGLLVVPLFSERYGTGSTRPGAMVGLSLSHGRAAIARAIMEGTAFEVRRMLQVMAQLGIPVRNIILSGGASQSHVWNQIHADVLARPVTTLSCPHAGVVGAGLLASLGTGIHVDIATGVRDVARAGATYEPSASTSLYDELFDHYEHTRASLVPHIPSPSPFERSLPASQPT